MSEHPFAQYIRIIGKGPRLSRPLTRDEARAATRLILKDEVEPVQLGAFLCILRVRTEDPEEGAGFIDAVRDHLELPDDLPKVDLDWPSYAGKVRQLPYFILAALCLSENGLKIFMHGVEGHTQGRLFTPDVLRVLGIRPCQSVTEAANQLNVSNFAYLGLHAFAPKLDEIIHLKNTLGVRTPVNTFARMINPFGAEHVVQCITHGAYREIHRDCAALLGDDMLVFKGEGGEIERRPAKPASLKFVNKGIKSEETWPPMHDIAQTMAESDMDPRRLIDLWSGKAENPWGESCVIGTIAIILRLKGQAMDCDSAHQQARVIWQARNKDRLPYATS